jgi:hypothetical protein
MYHLAHWLTYADYSTSLFERPALKRLNSCISADPALFAGLELALA